MNAPGAGAATAPSSRCGGPNWSRSTVERIQLREFPLGCYPTSVGKGPEHGAPLVAPPKWPSAELPLRPDRRIPSQSRGAVSLRTCRMRTPPFPFPPGASRGGEGSPHARDTLPRQPTTLSRNDARATPARGLATPLRHPPPASRLLRFVHGYFADLRPGGADYKRVGSGGLADRTDLLRRQIFEQRSQPTPLHHDIMRRECRPYFVIRAFGVQELARGTLPPTTPYF